MHPAPTTPLGQAFAAIIAILIAALAEHAAEHPVLARGLRATIRQLEKTAAQLDALAAAHRAGTLTPRRRTAPRVPDWWLRGLPGRGMAPATPPPPLHPHHHTVRDPPCRRPATGKGRVFFL